MAALALCAIFFFSMVPLLTAQGNIEEFTYKVNELRTRCETRYYRSCSSFLFWGSCRTSSCVQCSNYQVSVEQTGRRCKKGWRDYPGDCNTPICSPACGGGKVCTAPDQCNCLVTGAACTSTPCNDGNNCYPGTCVSGSCVCPSGFSGPNCQTFGRLPDITECTATLYANSPETVVGIANCAPLGQSPEPRWVNASNPTRLSVRWRLNYGDPLSVPDRSIAGYVQNSPVPFGLVDARFRTNTSLTEFQCNLPRGQSDSPPTSALCEKSQRWSEFSGTPQQNFSFNVTVQGTLGGKKRGSNQPGVAGSQFTEQSFAGVPRTSAAVFQFDLEPPRHCLSERNAECDVFAIYVENDVSTNPTFKPVFLNWTDSGSGIELFHVDVYNLKSSDVDNKLSNTGGPVTSFDVDPATNNGLFTLTASGVYSIELTVFDWAGNRAKARKIIIFDKDSKITTDRSSPVKIVEAKEEAGRLWMTKIGQKVTVQWPGHFSSSGHRSNSWANPVAEWQPQHGIDDRFENKYGRRSIASIPNYVNGIVAYNLVYAIDAQGGRRLTMENGTLQNFSGSVTQFEIPTPSLKDGDTIVVWLNANDMSGSGNDLVVTLNVSVDTTYPVVESHAFKLKPENDEFTSSVFINVTDPSSGIKEIEFQILDKTGKAVLYKGSAPPVEREAHLPPHARTKRGANVIRPCNPDTETTCYCTPLGKCFNVSQEIKIDHCWIDRYAGRSFQVLYSVRNWANLASTPQQQIDLGELYEHDIPCRQPVLTAGAKLGIVIGVLLGLAILALLIFILVTLVRVRVYHKPMPRRMQTIHDRFRREPIQRDNSIYASAGACSSGVTPAKSQGVNDCAPPPYKRYDHGGAVESVAVADDDDIYVYGTVPKRDIEYGTKIGEGRFAMIVKARIGKQDVAAKCLRNGHNASDVDLMKRKIEFLKVKVPAHVNIVRYVGDEQDDPAKGPVLLLELCEMPLHDWLKKVGKVDLDALENMLTFTINIAHGVEHLHKHQVVHKRLSARNVLLVKTLGVYVAKLIGFGPSTADEGAAKKVPLKWLAPETLDSLNAVPIYNKKTDAWTFGVVMMEIYSQGADPYPEIKSDEVAAYLKSGKRMSRPQHLPTELYDTVVTPCWNVTPSARPSFEQICHQLEEFRSGGEDGDDRGYYAPPTAGGAKNPTARYDDCRS